MSQYNDLIAGQYAGVVQFIEQVGGFYFGTNFNLSQTPTPWLLKLGRYTGNVGHGPIDLHGYWIYRTDADLCWQCFGGVSPGALGRRAKLPGIFAHFHIKLPARNPAVKSGNGPQAGDLRYWNQDGKAEANPENWELFVFAAVDPSQNTVKIKNNSGTGGGFVNLVGNTFYCNDDGNNAAIFRVKF